MRLLKKHALCKHVRLLTRLYSIIVYVSTIHITRTETRISIVYWNVSYPCTVL